MHGLLNAAGLAGQPKKHRRRPRSQIRHGHRRAAIQAFTAAKLWLQIPIPPPTQAEAAELTGAALSYLQAAAVLLEHDDASLIARVEAGRLPLLEAAAHVKKRVELIRAFKAASPADLAALGRTVGTDAVFDRVVVPALVV